MALTALCMTFFMLFSCSTVDSLIPGQEAAAMQSVTAEYMNIAQAYEKLKDYPKAIRYYEAAMKSRAGAELGDSAYYSIGRCYALAGDWEHAEPIYRSLLEKDPENTNLRASLAYISAMSGDLDAAAEQYAALTAENPADSSLLKNYISVLLASGKKEEAQGQLEVYREKFPDDAALPEIEKLFAPENAEKEEDQA